ncbi:MAG: hypothetical protein H6739_34245 [Alphaproteobacteria bacterium]|nr:hypothetical protein [Alphaproteobacteria bacterium]
MLAGTLLVSLGLGCTGFTLGENFAGQDTPMRYGAIAVDHVTEKVFTVVDGPDDAAALGEDGAPMVPSQVVQVDPDTFEPRVLARLDGREDPRMLFPEAGLLLLSERNGREVFQLFDRHTHQPKAFTTLDSRYWGTRSSPSRRWIAVADQTTYDIHILDPETLNLRVIPHDAQWLEAMWLNNQDRLLVVLWYHGDDFHPTGARLLAWDVTPELLSKPTTDGLWPDAALDVFVEGFQPDALFSFTWIGVSPDDRFAAFPMLSTDPDLDEPHRVLLLDTTTGEVREVPNTRGPVGFTPDGRTMVSYAGAWDASGEEVGQRLVLVDTETLERQEVGDPIQGLQYFVTHEGAYVVAAAILDESQTVILHDLDSGRSSSLGGAGVSLNEFVSHPDTGELFIASDGDLWRLDVWAGTLDQVPMPFDTHTLNLLPQRDLLVTRSTPDRQVLHFIDIGDGGISPAVRLPEPD